MDAVIYHGGALAGLAGAIQVRRIGSYGFYTLGEVHLPAAVDGAHTFSSTCKQAGHRASDPSTGPNHHV